MKLSKFQQWLYRKRLSRQMITFANLKKGDFIWEIRNDKNEFVTAIHKIDNVSEYRGDIKYHSVMDGWIYTTLTVTIPKKDVENSKTSFIFESGNNRTFFSNQTVFEKYLAIEKLKNNKAQSSQTELKTAIENANMLLMEKLKGIS